MIQLISTNNNVDKVVKVSYIGLLLVFLLSILDVSETFSRQISAIVAWMAIFLVPKYWYRQNDISKLGRVFVYLLLSSALCSLCMSIFFPENIQTSVYLGNKWLTLFGNQYCLLMMLSPLFVFMASYTNGLSNLIKYNFILLVIGIILYFDDPFKAFTTLWFFSVFYAYLSGKKKLFVYIMCLEALHVSLFIEDTVRMYLLFLLLIVANYVIVHVFQNDKYLKLFCGFLIIAPFIYMIPTLLDPDYSIFQIVMDYISEQGADDTLSSDTRSFLYWEMAEDLTSNNAWLLGKGADAHYYSRYFEVSTSGEGDFFYRLVVEVTFLQNLLRGGIVYASLYIGLLVYAVVNALRKGKSLFIKSVAGTIAAFHFATYINLLSGCGISNIMLFMMVGMCMSERWLNYTDDEIKQLVKI